jgi:restriction system protein
MANNRTFWMIRAGEGGYMLNEFIEKKIIAIGWSQIGDLSKVRDQNEIKSLLSIKYPEYTQPQINNFAAQIYKFRFSIEIGQKILSYNASERIYWIGEVKSAYKFRKIKKDTEEREYPHYRDINWIKSVPRDELSPASKNSLGSTLTVFNVSQDIMDELLGADSRNRKQSRAGEPSIEELENEARELELLMLMTEKAEIEQKGREFIKDKFMGLGAYELQDLIAGILRAMGYKTLVSAKGMDRGKDILASPDGLGLESPRIKVEVKHRGQKIGAEQLRSFISTLRSGERGVYVSTSGFTKDGKYEGDRSANPLTLIDNEMIADLIIEHYDKFDPETRALVPLKKIYWPV